MNVLVVYAHPNPQSYNAALFKLTCEQLALAGHTVHPLDLYETDFEARMSCEERINYMTQDNTNGIENHVAKLKWAEAVVFVYPTWWMGPPAILKGWLDRIWLPGVVATYGANGLQPGLTRIKKFLIITTQGSSHWRMALTGNPPRKMFRLSLKAVSRCKDIQWLALYSMNKTTEVDRKQFMEKVRKHLQSF
ncbi:NAD(P)H-dependent oxidoreductase [Endozoicomonas sp. 4G]|uniref:NAD(P)H-dependent oxidoreductase n=1 Tax=Endozoicomonas sp. 4G TaxID=2872754 RepID=UPI002078E502|nr:NAD(P)H-dependent oxidoreductase [Endozoicomonas sp. 4G]